MLDIVGFGVGFIVGFGIGFVGAVEGLDGLVRSILIIIFFIFI